MSSAKAQRAHFDCVSASRPAAPVAGVVHSAMCCMRWMVRLFREIAEASHRRQQQQQRHTVYLGGKSKLTGKLIDELYYSVAIEKTATRFLTFVFNTIKSIYEELSSDELLSRCLGGYFHFLSQNGNESFNATLWVPKSCASEKRVIDIAVCNFNDGFRNVMEIMKVLTLLVSN
ncbi:PREDICTED: uncharacterized protein LOC105617852 [Atta cephalotes]|uniref:Uncharacterized protein n=1 Tax=Atta cephalotes TaxID=12957 RepID=A0A158NB83_ATTCE|nr:PREDICTED: uncharacterized protein LOC105617852 [Atta cephalotes]